MDDVPDTSIEIDKHRPMEHAELGYRGDYTLWTPDHVILESSDGHRFSFSKESLGHSRQVSPLPRSAFSEDSRLSV